MAPARGLLLRRHCNSHGSLIMAEKIDSDSPSGGGGGTENIGNNKQLQEEIKENNQGEEESYEGWLQLGIPTCGATAATGSRRPSTLNLGEEPPPAAAAASFQHSSSSSLTPRKRARSTELDPPPPPTSMLMPPPFPPGGVLSTYRGPPAESAAPAGEMTTTTATRAVVRPRLPLPRPQAGVWCKLEAAQNQVKEPFLPQIPKSYLRTKYLDGTMTVNLLLKYLANKLGLEDQSKVEITCRGQQLPPYLTLQHIRDNIWRPSEIIELHQDSRSTDHIMTLQYSRK